MPYPCAMSATPDDEQEPQATGAGPSDDERTTVDNEPPGGDEQEAEKDAARGRQTWRASPEYRRAFRVLWIGGCAIILLVIGSVTLVLLVPRETNARNSSVLLLAFVPIMIAALIGFSLILYLGNTRRDFDDKVLLGLANELRREESKLSC